MTVDTRGKEEKKKADKWEKWVKDERQKTEKEDRRERRRMRKKKNIDEWRRTLEWWMMRGQGWEDRFDALILVLSITVMVLGLSSLSLFPSFTHSLALIFSSERGRENLRREEAKRREKIRKLKISRKWWGDKMWTERKEMKKTGKDDEIFPLSFSFLLLLSLSLSLPLSLSLYLSRKKRA